jgi:acyl-CoA synthetase (AMP-forming)/AMP-acid ligase II
VTVSASIRILPDALRRLADRAPERPLVEGDFPPLTYGTAARLSAGGSSALRAAGVGAGDRVVVALPFGADYVASYLSVLRTAVVVPVPHDASGPTLAKYLADTQARAAILGDGREALDLRGLPELRAVFGRRPARLDAHVAVHDISDLWRHAVTPDPPLHEEDLALILYTSGSSASPKGVMLSHRAISSNAVSVVEYLKLDERERTAMLLAPHYSYGDSLLRTHLVAGGCLVKIESATMPGRAVEEIRRGACTGISGVASAFALLLTEATFDGPSLPTVRYLTQAGGPIPRALVSRLRAAFASARLFLMYGQTEAGPRLTYLPPEDLDRKPFSVGIPVPGVSLEVVSDSGSPVERGQPGELVARGDGVMMGYWRDPSGTQAVLRNGTLHTRDLAWIDSDGYVHLIGRKDEVIKSGSHRIHPREVEEVIEGIDEVAACVVVARPDSVLGAVVVAVVVPRGGAKEAVRAVFRACRERLPEHKRPVRVEIDASLPTGASGKVARGTLRGA